MELNWSTFVLEMINFLVLVWILKRFLYKPVLNVIARRQSGIDKALDDAKALHQKAEQLQRQYEGRIADWENERRQARESLAGELDAERAKRLAELQTALEQERERSRVAEARRQENETRKLEAMAMSQGARFASRLLGLAAGQDLHLRLVDLLTDELEALPAERLESVRGNYTKAPEVIVVTSPYPLSEEQRRRLEKALIRVAGSEIPVRYESGEELLAGLRIIMGAWVLGANIQDELKGFADLTSDENEPGQTT